MKRLLFGLLALAAVTLACKKESSDTKPAVDYLKAHKWLAVSNTISPANDWYATGTKITDLLAPLSDCEKDNLLVFDTDTTYYTLTSTLKCDADEQEKERFDDYYITTDQKYIHRSELTVPALIKEISDTKLVLETSFKDKDNVTYVLTETYQAK